MYWVVAKKKKSYFPTKISINKVKLKLSEAVSESHLILNYLVQPHNVYKKKNSDNQFTINFQCRMCTITWFLRIVTAICMTRSCEYRVQSDRRTNQLTNPDSEILKVLPNKLVNETNSLHAAHSSVSSHHMGPSLKLS